MFKLVSIEKSKKEGKKYTAYFLDKETGKEKKIHFGAEGYRDYTLINNKKSKFYIDNEEEREKVKSQYIRRHKKDLLTEAGKTGMSPGALSFYVLWNKKTLDASIKQYKRLFNL